MKKYIKLTHDLAPIYYYIRNKISPTANFICPLPKNFKLALKKVGIDKVCEKIDELIDEINEQAEKQEGQFINILFGYFTRNDKDRKDLLKRHFKLTRNHLHIDKDRGFCGIWAGTNINSGDIYLGSDGMNKCDSMAYEFREFFDDKYAFYCHNVDFYWQALLTREICLRYYNWLVEILEKNDL